MRCRAELPATNEVFCRLLWLPVILQLKSVHIEQIDSDPAVEEWKIMQVQIKSCQNNHK